MASDNLRCVLTLECKISTFSVYRRGKIRWQAEIEFTGLEIATKIACYFRWKHQLLIRTQSCRHILNVIGSVVPLSQESTYQVRGRNITNGLPDALEISSIEIRDYVREVASSIVGDFYHLFERRIISYPLGYAKPLYPKPTQASEDLRQEILGVPIQIMGEYGTLRGLPEYLSQELGRGFFVESEQNS